MTQKFDDGAAVPNYLKGIEGEIDTAADEARAINRAIVESITGPDLPPSERRGYYPKFWRHEADMIIKDKRTIAEIADDYGVSHVTILRVKSRGKWEGIPYVARDDLNPLEVKAEREQVKLSQKLVDHIHKEVKHKRGRPAMLDTSTLTSYQIDRIAYDRRPVQEIMDEYGMSRSMYYKLKKAHRDIMRSGIIPEWKRTLAVKEVTVNRRPIKEVGYQLGIPESVIAFWVGATKVTSKSNKRADALINKHKP